MCTAPQWRDVARKGHTMQHLFGKRHHKPEPPHCRKDRKRKDDPCKRRLKKDCHKPHSRKKCD